MILLEIVNGILEYLSSQVSISIVLHAQAGVNLRFFCDINFDTILFVF